MICVLSLSLFSLILLHFAYTDTLWGLAHFWPQSRRERSSAPPLRSKRSRVVPRQAAQVTASIFALCFAFARVKAQRTV